MGDALPKSGGFDMMAAEAIVSLKRIYPDITLIAAIPFKGQASRFSSYDRKRYDKLLEAADEVIVLSDRYYPRCFFLTSALFSAIR